MKAVCEIDISALLHNFRLVRKTVGSERAICAVVKAQAYGHGALPVARALSQAGATMLGVATVEEGLELRCAGITCPVLILGGILPEEARDVVENGLTPVVFHHDQTAALEREARQRRRTVSLHVKVDSGMGRLGLVPEQVPAFIKKLTRVSGLVVEGIMTHFSESDMADKAAVALQVERFGRVQRDLADQGVTVPLIHAANSGAILDYPPAFFSMVRPGIMLYGYYPSPKMAKTLDLRPVMSLKTRIIHIKKVSSGEAAGYGKSFIAGRDSLIAILPLGYANGLNRLLSNRGEAILQGKKVPLVGNICMDMTMIDVTEHPDVKIGDDVALLGRDGGAAITAEDIALLIGTIPYEVLCTLGYRVPRTYTHLPA